MTWPYRVNVLDLEPRGPLPPEIYWRRRGLAIGIAVVRGRRRGRDHRRRPERQRRRQHLRYAAKKPTAQGRRTRRPEVKTQVEPPAGENTDQPAETPTAAVQPPPVLNAGDDCPDSTLAVKGLTNAPQYAIGDQPKFVMVVTNIGLVACKRDVGAAVLAAYVYSLDNKRLWSNLDCAPSNETLVKTFAPGEQVTTAVTWTGMGSAPHCPLPRPAIGPGTYNLVVQLGNLRSLAVPFIMAPPLPPGAAPAPPPGLPGPPAPGPLPGPAPAPAADRAQLS